MGNKIAIILAVVLGGMAVMLVNNHLASEKQKFMGDPIEIVVATERIDKGVTLSLRHMRKTTLPAKFLQNSGVYTEWEKRNGLVGGKTRLEIAPGEFLSQRIIEHGNLDVVGGIDVRSGLRGYTISASGENAVANMLVVGDRVDIMGTFLILGGEQGVVGERTQRARTMFLMQDIEVKALDQVTAGKTKGSFGMITFELQPLECLVLEFAQNTGKVKLVKRNRDEAMTSYNPDQRIEVYRENLLDFIKIANQQRAQNRSNELGGAGAPPK